MVMLQTGSHNPQPMDWENLRKVWGMVRRAQDELCSRPHQVWHESPPQRLHQSRTSRMSSALAVCSFPRSTSTLHSTCAEQVSTDSHLCSEHCTRFSRGTHCTHCVLYSSTLVPVSSPPLPQSLPLTDLSTSPLSVVGSAAPHSVTEIHCSLLPSLVTVWTQ